MKVLKEIRALVAAGVFLLMTLFFLGIGAGCGLLEHVQIVPALLGCALVPVLLWVVVTLLFGRLYCSMACPLGILQDLLSRLATGVFWGRRRFRPRRNHPFVRGGAVVAFLLGLLIGGASLASLLDPYGTYGRFATHLFLPAADWLNNVLAGWLGTDGSLVLFRRELFLRSFSGFVLAGSSLIVLTVLVAWRGRLICNTICPVGALLGALSKKSVFQIEIDHKACVKCGLCSKVCKAQCLDGRSQTIDNTRCVRCFNCIGACPKGAISYRTAGEGTMSGDRRRFLGEAGIGAVAGTVLAGTVLRRTATAEQVLPPPGADVANLRAKCTACGLCVARCPRRVIVPAGFTEYGPLGFMLPKLDFTHGFCDPNCTVCGTVCPSEAIRPLSLEMKKATRIGVATWDRTVCLVCSEEHLTCKLCSRRCPQKAITLKEEKVMKDGKVVMSGDRELKISIPVVDVEACTGCGACEHYCPVHAMKVKPVGGQS